MISTYRIFVINIFVRSLNENSLIINLYCEYELYYEYI